MTQFYARDNNMDKKNFCSGLTVSSQAQNPSPLEIYYNKGFGLLIKGELDLGYICRPAGSR